MEDAITENSQVTQREFDNGFTPPELEGLIDWLADAIAEQRLNEAAGLAGHGMKSGGKNAETV